MLPKKVTIFLLAGFGLIGVLIAGNGITGLVTFDETVQPLCQTNDECGENTCCLFYEESAGVCHQPGMCQTVLDITREEGIRRAEMQAKQVKASDAVKEQFSYRILLGIGLILLAAIIAHASHHSRTNQSKSINTSKKKTKSTKRGGSNRRRISRPRSSRRGRRRNN